MDAFQGDKFCLADASQTHFSSACTQSKLQGVEAHVLRCLLDKGLCAVMRVQAAVSIAVSL